MKPLSEQKESLLYYNICLSDIFFAVKEDELNVGFQASSDLISSLYCTPDALRGLANNKRQHKIKVNSSKFGKADENTLFSCSSKVGIRRLKNSNQFGFNF
jgi:hypothetical protein